MDARKNKKLFLLLFLILASISLSFGANDTLQKYADNSIYVPSDCMPSLKKVVWSDCEDGSQNRFIVDLNSCIEDKDETRSCTTNQSEVDALFYNAKPIDMVETSPRRYNAYLLDNTYYEVLSSNILVNNSFILTDTNKGTQYIARMIDEDEMGYLYLIEVIQEDTIFTLEDEGLITYYSTISEDVSELAEDVASHQSFPTVMVVIGFMIALTVILFISFYMKRLHRKQTYSSILNAKGTEDNKQLENKYAPEELDKYKNYITDVRDYVNRNKALGEQQVRENLKKAGWNDIIIDSVISDTKFDSTPDSSSTEEKKE